MGLSIVREKVTGSIRIATDTDAAAIRTIYAPFILDGATSFEMDVPEEVEFLERILEVLQDAPWLVYEEEGKVLGYAYASEHRKRKAYKWTREVSVYLDPSCQGRGVATRLYNVLFDILKRQGFINLLAGVTLPNTSSVSLHRKMGFEPIGTYHKVGYKRGQFWDVAWFEKLISDSKPSTPKTLADLGYKPGQFI